MANQGSYEQKELVYSYRIYQARGWPISQSWLLTLVQLVIHPNRSGSNHMSQNIAQGGLLEDGLPRFP